ncbi:PH domain-containing protein [bacterium]|nr:PH domain-containing protein [bacterium]
MNLYPSAKELLDSASEDGVIMRVRRTPRSMLGLFCWAVIFATIISLVARRFPGIAITEQIYFSTYWLLLFPIGLCGEAWRRYHDDLYTFEQERVVHHGGRLSLQYTVPMVRYEDLRAVTVDQDIFGRIFDYGDVELNTAALDSGELYCQGVRAPDQLALLLEELKQHCRESKS